MLGPRSRSPSRFVWHPLSLGSQWLARSASRQSPGRGRTVSGSLRRLAPSSAGSICSKRCSWRVLLESPVESRAVLKEEAALLAVGQPAHYDQWCRKANHLEVTPDRSEEHRVGKECRSR